MEFTWYVTHKVIGPCLVFHAKWVSVGRYHHVRVTENKKTYTIPCIVDETNWPSSDGIVPVKLQPADEMNMMINRDHNTTD